MADPLNPDPRRPADQHPDAPRYTDPATDPRIANQTIVQPASRGRGGLIAAGVIAVLLVIALIAFSGGPATDSGTTAVIPDEQTDTAPAPAPAPAPGAAPESAPPAETPPAAPEAAPPAETPPAANQ